MTETAEQKHDRLEREWLAARAAANCEDCACFHQMHAERSAVDSVVSTIAALCRKAPDVDRTWAAVIGQVRDEVVNAIEVHGWCEAWEFGCYGNDPCGDCEQFVPFKEAR